MKILIIGTLSNINNSILTKCEEWLKSGAKIITTCPDLSDPGYCNDNFISPCKIIHMLSFKNTPISYYNIGKPNPMLKNIIKKHIGINALNKVMFVGDTIDTDIQFATENNMISCYIISSQKGAIELRTTILYPDIVCNNMTDLEKTINKYY